MDVDAHVRRIIAIHFDPEGGSPYWLRRERELGIDARADIGTAGDLDLLGPVDDDDLRRTPLLDFMPLSRRDSLRGAFIAETGGTSGPPKRTIFSRSEFQSAFVTPFIVAAQQAGFPRGGMWLWIGPSGPHIIGHAAVACAVAMDAPQPLSVDFDPRWYRKLPDESMARRRYLAHLIEQAMVLIEHEPIDVIFTTPVVLEKLAGAMSNEQRRRIRGVHYGGMRITRELLRSAQCEWFSNAVHLAGYGDSLFGVCMELGGPADRVLRYYPYGARHLLRVANDGYVLMSRLDETVLIANLASRDMATPAAPPDGIKEVFGPGIEDPHPAESDAGHFAGGIY